MEAIRIAIAGLIHDHKAGLLAKKMGLNLSTLYKWAEAGTENNPHGNIPLDKAIQLTLVAADSRIMDAIAAEAGGTFVPGHQLVEGRFGSEMAACQVLKASAALIEEYACALQDGKVTPGEYKELAREAMQLHLATAAIVESARAKAGI